MTPLFKALISSAVLGLLTIPSGAHSSEQFFEKNFVLATPYPNQVRCDFLNAAAVSTPQGILVLHRADFERFGRDENLLMATLNDEQGKLKAVLKTGDFRPIGTASTATTEDPRLCMHNGEIYGLYTSTETGERADPRFFCLARMSLKPEAKMLSVESVHRLHYSRQRRVEKNWVPLSHDGDLFIVYSLFPCRILRVDMEYGDDSSYPVHDVYLSGRSYSPDGLKFFSNSTNFIPIELDGKPHYLGMYHFFMQVHPRLFPAPSDRTPVLRNYFGGFIVLEGQPPFAVTHCTPPILDSMFDFRSRDRVVFPSNCWIKEDQFFTSVGIRDRETWLVSGSLDRVLQRCREWPLVAGQPQWKWGSIWPGSRWPIQEEAPIITSPFPEHAVWMDPS